MTATRISLWTGIVALVLASQAHGQTGEPAKAAKPVTSLAGTKWAGTEDLEGFGKLSFFFHKGNKATMIDAAGQSEGAYEQKADEVVITFANGDVAYAGKINGTSIIGAAANKQKATWKWSAKQVGANPKPAAPVADGAPAASGPAATGPGAPAAAAAPAPVKTPEALAEILTKLGLKPKVVTPDIGPGYCVVTLKDKDNWNYVVEVKIQKGIWMTATLDQLPKGPADTEKLMRLLEANDAISPCFFFFRAADRRLCLKLEIFNLSDQGLMSDFQTLTNSVRLTHDLWNTANWSKEAPAEMDEAGN